MVLKDKAMESNDPVWKLLERSPLPEPDAWFAARTVARLRREQSRPTWQRRLWMSLAWASSTAVVTILAVHFMSVQPQPEAHTAKIQEALNFIADRGTETDLWLATSTL